MARIHTRWSATCSCRGDEQVALDVALLDGPALGDVPRAGVVDPAKTSEASGRTAGSGTAGISSWWSSPPSGSWKEQLIDRIGLPCWIAWTRRVENDRPSRIRSTLKVIGWVSSPGRMK